MPWVKLSSKFFEDSKLDGLSTQEMLGIIWLITESARQNHGYGIVRVCHRVMAGSLRLWRRVDAELILNCAVRIGVIIEITPISKHGSSEQEVRGKKKNKNPLNPLSEEVEKIRSSIDTSLEGNKFPTQGSETADEE